MNIMNKSKPIRTKRRYLFLNNRLFMKYNIKQLPPQLRNMIYIICMRNFWRQYIPLTSKVPTWYNLRLSQEEQLFHARQNNIHFLHIDSNTLPEYKNYIIGCQCHFCKYMVPEEHQEQEQLNTLKSIQYFNDTIPSTESKWNSPLEHIYDPDTGEITNGYPIFSPYYDLIENMKDIINGPPIEFSRTTKELFP